MKLVHEACKARDTRGTCGTRVREAQKQVEYVARGARENVMHEAHEATKAREARGECVSRIRSAHST